MQSRIRNIFVGACALTMTIAVAFAQPRGPRYYDPSKEVTINGTIDDVQQAQKGRFPGTHLMVKTGTETVDVRLGPSYFIENHGFSFAKGDQVEILGAKANVNGVDVVIAREVTKDGKKLTLRDTTGRPMWAGRRT
jgi:hypothetical protein